MSIHTIGLHLKAGVGSDDGARRHDALVELDGYIRNRINMGDEDEIVIAGDYNEVLNTSVGQATLGASAVTSISANVKPLVSRANSTAARLTAQDSAR